MQKHDRDNAGDDHEAIWGDMMSVLQIPKLPTGACFYKRKYRVYNEGFYLASNKQHSMLLWGELDARKIPLSALHQFLETIPDTNHLICWFDGTSSQLKNVTTLMYFLHRTNPKSKMFKWDRVSLKYNPPGHTYMSPGPDQAFASVSKQMKKRTIIGDPKEVLSVINDACKNCSAGWLEGDEHFDWTAYLAQFYATDNNFLRVDGQGALLRKSRWFSFGFSEVLDERTGAILVQNDTNEIKARLSFDANAP